MDDGNWVTVRTPLRARFHHQMIQSWRLETDFLEQSKQKILFVAGNLGLEHCEVRSIEWLHVI